MPPVRLQILAAAGFGLLCACNDTSNLAPGAPDTPAQFRTSNEETTSPAPTGVTTAKFTIPPNTAVELPPPADIDANHVYALAELIDIAQRRNPTTRVAWEEARQAAIKVGIAQAAYLPALTASALAGYETPCVPTAPLCPSGGFRDLQQQGAGPGGDSKVPAIRFRRPRRER